MGNLELKIPPPVVAATMLAAMWLLSRTLPRFDALGQARVAVAIGLAVLGVAVAGAGAIEFKRARTTVDPRRPAEASSLVTSGVYRMTRNPMYLGLTLVLLGWAALLSSPATLAGPAAFIAYMSRFQIRPEERILLDKFGGEYREYMARVRRWL